MPGSGCPWSWCWIELGVSDYHEEGKKARNKRDTSSHIGICRIESPSACLAKRLNNREETATLSQKHEESSTYAMGYSDEFTQILHRRNAETHAAHLLPHLRPGSRVLDVGCGPGSISVGLAKAIEPGELHGIDMEESQIMIARASAAAGGHDNATFHVGDATDLPFEDDSFDAAHTHAVLMHVP